MLLLAAIASGATHGYAIAQTLHNASDGTVDLKDGTIYPALQRLERQGFVSSRWTEGDGRRRRTYSLTRSGRAALARQRDDWREFERAVGGVLALLH